MSRMCRFAFTRRRPPPDCSRRFCVRNKTPSPALEMYSSRAMSTTSGAARASRKACALAAFDADQIHLALRFPKAHDMRVRIDEPGQHGGPREIQELRVRSAEGLRLGGVRRVEAPLADNLPLIAESNFEHPLTSGFS